MKEIDEDKVSSLEGLSSFSMDFASKGLSWGESICQKLDNAIQDNLIVQKPSMFIDALGDHLKKIYVEVADDWLNPFSDGSVEGSKPDLVEDMKDEVPGKSTEALDEQLIEEKKRNNAGLDTTSSSGQYTLAPLACIPLNAGPTSGVCRNVISSLPEPPQEDFSDVTGQVTYLPSSHNIHHASLWEMSDEDCKSSVSSPIEPTEHELSTATGQDSGLCSSSNMPRDISVVEASAELCKCSFYSPDEPSQNEFSITDVLDEGSIGVVSCAKSNPFSVTQHISISKENQVITEPGNILPAYAYSEEFPESSDIPGSNITAGDTTDLNNESILIEEFENVELEDVWEDSILDEIILILQHKSKKAFDKKKRGTLAAIASRLISEKKKNDDQVMTSLHADSGHLKRKGGDVDLTSVPSEKSMHNSSLASLEEACESDWELV